MDGKHLNIIGRDIEGLYDEPYVPSIEFLNVTEIANEVPLDYSLFEGLKTLYISSLEAYTFPKEICSLPLLERIVCSGKCLVPPEIGKAPKLEELVINGDCVLDMTETIAEAPTLRTLSVSHYGDAAPCEMPEWIANLPQLENLHLYLCFFSGIDPDINNLKNLRTLSIIGALSAAHDFPVLSNLKKLERLEVTGDGFNGLPKPPYGLFQKVLDGIAELSALTSLNLSGWRSRKKADYLVLNENGRSIPDVFDRYPNLVSLDISGMRIDFLPPSIHRLPRLERLEADGNNLVMH
ncbi:MAG: hypothetical protein FWH47_04270 [Methanomassiliicoccaceae archaeon]|nr:hypothetical protein [Methanomassiliicoccaceae archaeon]